MINKKLKVGNVPNKGRVSFDKNKIKAPQLRFIEFSEPWKSSRLAEICEINPKNENLPTSFVYIDLESVSNGRLLKEDIISKDEAPSRAQRVLLKNDVLFQMVRPYQKNNLFFDKEGKYVASTGYAQIRTEQNSRFVFQYLHNQKFVDNVIERCTGTSYPAINSTDLGNIKIEYPGLKEQEKISSFLSLIDERIQTQNKIIKELNVLKTSLTKRMFSRHLRFKNAKGNNFPDWKLMTLGDIGEVRMCRRIFNDETSSTGDIPFFKIGSFGKEADAFISKKLYEDYRGKFSFPKKGNILISAAGTIGRTVVYKGEDAYYQDSNIVWIDNDNTKVVNEFLYYILQIVKYNTEGGTIQRLYNNILKSTKFSCPSFPEQTKIANFLSSIDSKIDIESQFLQKLEKQKKFLLQQMFV